VLSENRGFGSAGSGDAAVGSARFVSCRGARSNSDRRLALVTGFGSAKKIGTGDSAERAGESGSGDQITLGLKTTLQTELTGLDRWRNQISSILACVASAVLSNLHSRK
jgi:hypothetical protein